MLNLNKKLTHTLILPLIIGSYAYIFNIKGASGSIEVFDVDGCFPMPILRGMADMGVGVLLSAVIQRSGRTIEKYPLLLNIACIIAMAVLIIELFAPSYYDKYALLSFLILIISGIIPGTWMTKLLSSERWIKLGGISYEMLLIHAPIIWVIDYITCDMRLSQWGNLFLAFVYISILILFSWLLKLIGEKLRAIVECYIYSHQNKVI